MATHSSVLAWRIPMATGAWQAMSPWGHKDLDMIGQLNNNNSNNKHLYRTSIYNTTVSLKAVINEESIQCQPHNHLNTNNNCINY